MTNARSRVRIGTLDVDVLCLSEAVDAIDGLVAAGRGGAVFTPNVDHIVTAAENDAFATAYQNVSLALARAPAYVLWKLTIAVRRAPSAWQRTPRST